VALLCVLTGSRNIKFQALAIEDLIVIESRRGLIECNMFAWECFIVTSSAFGCPLRSTISKVVLHFFVGSQYIFSSFKKWILNFRVIGRTCTSTSLTSMKYSDLRMCCLKIIKSIRSRHEYAIGLWSLFLRCSECSSWCGWFTLDSKIKLAFGIFLDFNEVSNVCPRIRTLLWVKPWLLESMSIAAKWAKSDALLLLLASVFLVPGRCL